LVINRTSTYKQYVQIQQIGLVSGQIDWKITEARFIQIRCLHYGQTHSEEQICPLQKNPKWV